MRLLFQTRKQGLPIADSARVHALQVHMSYSAEKTILELLAKPVIDGQCNDERGHASPRADEGDDGDYADDGLAALGAQIPGRNKELESQAVSPARLEKNGTRGTALWYW